LEFVKRALRRRWPEAEYAALLEFTTGYGPRSGGLRRPHWNLLIKGVPAEAAEEAGAAVFPIWCRQVDALPDKQHASAIYAPEGLVRYMAKHFSKSSQAPPEGFRGQRFNCSRGYFTGCSRATARARARDSLSLKRALWRARQAQPDASAHDVELNGQLAYRLALSTRWVLATSSGARISRESIVLPGAADRMRARYRAADLAAGLSPAWADALAAAVVSPGARSAVSVAPDSPRAAGDAEGSSDVDGPAGLEGAGDSPASSGPLFAQSEHTYDP
jgi:hypothetical protein